MMKSLADFNPTGNVGQASAAPLDRAGIDSMIDRLSPEYGLDPQLVKAVVQLESGYDPNAKASTSTASGLMQLIRGTAQEMGVQDVFHPEQNLRGGMQYLSQQIQNAGGDWQKGLRMYNQGPGGDLSKADSYVNAISKNYKGGEVSTSTKDIGSILGEVMAVAPSNAARNNQESNGLNIPPIVPDATAIAQGIDESAIGRGFSGAVNTPLPTTGKLPFGVTNKGGPVAQWTKDVLYGLPEGLMQLGAGLVGLPAAAIGGTAKAVTSGLAEGQKTFEEISHTAMGTPQTATAQYIMKPFEAIFGGILNTGAEVVKDLNPNATPEELDNKIKATHFVMNLAMVAPMFKGVVKGKGKVGPEKLDESLENYEVNPEVVENAKEKVLADPEIPADVKVDVANVDVNVISDIAKKVKEARKAEKVAEKKDNTGIGEDVPLDVEVPKKWEPSPGDMVPEDGVADAFAGEPGTSYIPTPDGPAYIDRPNVKVVTPESIAEKIDPALKYDGKMAGIPEAGIEDTHSFTLTLEDGRQPSFSIAGDVTPEKVQSALENTRSKFQVSESSAIEVPEIETPSIIPEFDTIDLAKGEGYTALTKKRYTTPEEASTKAYETEGAQVIKVGDKYRVVKYEESKIPEYVSEDALKADGWEALGEIPERRAKYYEPQEGGGPVVRIGDKYYRTIKYEEMPDKVRVNDYLDSISEKLEDDVSPEDWAALEVFKKAGIKYELEKVDGVKAALEAKKVEDTTQSNAALAQSFLEWRDSYVPKYDIGKPKDAKPVTKESIAIVDDAFKIFDSEESAQQYLQDVGKAGEVIRDPLTGKYSILESDKFQMLDDIDMWEDGVEQYSNRDIYDDGSEVSPDFELSDTGTRDLWSILNNERGSVDITPLYKAIDNIESAVKMAKKAGQSIDEYLTSIGVDEIAINAFKAAMAQLPQLKQQVAEKDPVTSAVFKPEGKVVARRRKWKGQGDKRKVVAQSVPITEELANAALSADRTKQWGTDVKFEDPVSGKIKVHHTSNMFERFMEATEVKVNSFRSAGLSNIYSMWREAKRNAAVEKDTVRGWIRGLKEEVGKDRLNDFAIAAYADMKSVKEAYDTMGIKDIPELTVREQQILESLLEYLRRHRDRANYIRINTGQKPIPKLLDVNGKENYLPLLRDINVLRDLGINEGFTISNTSKLGELSKTFNGMFNPHTKKRNVSDIPIELDPFKAIERYLDYGIDELHISPVAALAKDLANVKLPRLDGKGKISLQNWNPQLATMLSKWSDHIVGKDPVATAMANANPLFSRAVNTLSKNLVIATIGGSLRTIMVQPTSFIIGVPTLLNGRSAVYGMYKAASRRSHPGLKNLSVPVIREAEFAYKELADYIQQGNMSGWKSYVADKSLAPMKWVDSMMAEATGNAALYYGEKYLKLKDKDLYRFADDIVERTQGMGLKGAVSDIQSSAATKWLTLLQTFGIADFNLIARDVLGIKNPDVNRSQTIVRVAKYIGMSMVAGQLYKLLGLDNVVPDPIGAYKEAIEDDRTVPGAVLSAAGELLEKVPVIGGSAKYGSSLGGIAGEFGNIVPEAAQKFSELVDWGNLTARQKRTNLRLVAKAVGYSMGIPFTNQIAKSINTAYKGGNPYEAIVGVYVEEQKRKGLRPRINRPKMPRPGSQVN